MKLFELKYLRRIDLRVLCVTLGLMVISIIVMSEAHSLNNIEEIIIIW